MKALLLTAVIGLGLTACAQTHQCVQPDPVEPAHGGCWNQGVDCGTGITDPVNN